MTSAAPDQKDRAPNARRHGAGAGAGHGRVAPLGRVVVQIERLAADALLGATTERDLIVVAALTRPTGRHFRVE